MKLQMLTDGKPTNLIKTHALLSQNRKIESALPKKHQCLCFLPLSQMTELLQEFIALGVKSLPSSPQTQSKGSKIDKASPSVNLQDQNCVSGARVLTGTVHNAEQSKQGIQ